MASSPPKFTLGVLRELLVEIAFSRDFSSSFFSFSHPHHVLSRQFPPNYHTRQILDGQECHALLPGHRPFSQSSISLTVIPLLSNSTPNVIVMHKYPD
jgi:hypothetical protein